MISKKVKKFTRRGYRSSSRLALVFSYYVVFFLFPFLFSLPFFFFFLFVLSFPFSQQLSAAIHKSPPPAPSWPTSPTSSQLVKGSRPTQECSVNVLLTRRGRNHFFEIFISSSTCVCVLSDRHCSNCRHFSFFCQQQVYSPNKCDRAMFQQCASCV